jgi:hypothetical protein
VLVDETVGFLVRATDEDCDLQAFEWYYEDQPLAWHTTSGCTADDSWSYTFDEVGVHHIYAYVYDDLGAYDMVWWEVVALPDQPTDGEFFDDFTYPDPDDATMPESHGWVLVDGVSAPPGGAVYSADNVSFEDDPTIDGNRVMDLMSETTDQFSDMRLACIHTDERKFLEGTYAARVYFDDTPKEWEDGNVETFYSIHNVENDPAHSECDFEYLPWDSWSVNPLHPETMYMVTWEAFYPPDGRDRAFSTITESHAGWHTLIFEATDGVSVRYYIDGELRAEHDVSAPPYGNPVYPDSDMRVNFANWITSRGSSTERRYCHFKVDWVYHAKNVQLSEADVLALVQHYRQQDIRRLDTMPATHVPDSGMEVLSEVEVTAYPNPFNPETKLVITLQSDSRVALAIFDAAGRHVRTLVDNAWHQAGVHVLRWDGRDDDGRKLASGVYLCRVEAESGTASSKIVLLK